MVARLIAGFSEVSCHRGNRLTRVASALLVALTGSAGQPEVLRRSEAPSHAGRVQDLSGQSDVAQDPDAQSISSLTLGSVGCPDEGAGDAEGWPPKATDLGSHSAGPDTCADDAGGAASEQEATELAVLRLPLRLKSYSFTRRLQVPMEAVPGMPDVPVHPRSNAAGDAAALHEAAELAERMLPLRLKVYCFTRRRLENVSRQRLTASTASLFWTPQERELAHQRHKQLGEFNRFCQFCLAEGPNPTTAGR